MLLKKITSCFVVLFLFATCQNLFAQQLVSKPFVGHSSKDEIRIWSMFKNADTVYIKTSFHQTEIFAFNKELSFKKYLPIVCTLKNVSEQERLDIQYSFDDKNYFPLLEVLLSPDTLNDFSFLAGSCAYIGTGFNRVLKPFNSLTIFQHMKNDNADFMLWMGDNLYYVLQRHNYKAQLKRNIKTRLNKKLSAFLHSKQQYAIWDDHDYGTNNSDATFKYKSSSLSVFQQFWPNPENETHNYFTFKKSDCQFFMLDDRYFNEKENIVLGKQQLDWLKQELLSSTGTFKFIGIGIQAINPLSTMECFRKAGQEYHELIEFIREHKISGVLFISGDRHHAELIKVEEENLYPLYDFTTSPLTMYPVKISKRNPEFSNPFKVAGTYFPSYNYGKISVSGAPENRKCILELKDKNGNQVWKHEIFANELKFE